MEQEKAVHPSIKSVVVLWQSKEIHGTLKREIDNSGGYLCKELRSFIK